MKHSVMILVFGLIKVALLCNPAYAGLDAANGKVVNMGNPSASTDGANKNYVDTHSATSDAHHTQQFKASIAFEDPTATDDFFFNEIAANATAVSIYCKTLVGTVELDVTIGGSDINGTDITCNTTGVLDSSLGGDTDLNTGEELKLEITSVASDPTYLMVIVNGTHD